MTTSSHDALEGSFENQQKHSEEISLQALAVHLRATTRSYPK
jgi:hypothetical protein